MSLSQFQSHKTVKAAKILGASGITPDGGAVLKVEGVKDVFNVGVDATFVRRNVPEGLTPDALVGGYYVQYTDGYESWSPAQAFEAGYTKIGTASVTTTYAPPPVKGYRVLTQAEVDLMNEIKAKAEEVEMLADKIRAYAADQLVTADGDARARLLKAEPGRWAQIGRTDLQHGFMALVRAVAQPNSF